MSRPIVYIGRWSPPSCAVLITAKAIGLDLDVRKLDLLKGEHLRKDYGQINIQKTVPTLNDNGFILWDSHAIMTYLVGKYANNDVLYSKDLKKRAIIDQRLYYDCGILFSIVIGTFKPLFSGVARSIPPESIEKLDEAYKFMDKLLAGESRWLADDSSYTLADISCSTTLNGLEILKSMDDYPNVAKWMANCRKNLPGFDEISGQAAREADAIIKSIIKT